MAPLLFGLLPSFRFFEANFVVIKLSFVPKIVILGCFFCCDFHEEYLPLQHANLVALVSLFHSFFNQQLFVRGSPHAKELFHRFVPFVNLAVFHQVDFLGFAAYCKIAFPGLPRASFLTATNIPHSSEASFKYLAIALVAIILPRYIFFLKCLYSDATVLVRHLGEEN